MKKKEKIKHLEEDVIYYKRIINAMQDQLDERNAENRKLTYKVMTLKEKLNSLGKDHYSISRELGRMQVMYGGQERTEIVKLTYNPNIEQ